MGLRAGHDRGFDLLHCDDFVEFFYNKILKEFESVQHSSNK